MNSTEQKGEVESKLSDLLGSPPTGLYSSPPCTNTPTLEIQVREVYKAEEVVTPLSDHRHVLNPLCMKGSLFICVTSPVLLGLEVEGRSMSGVSCF